MISEVASNIVASLELTPTEGAAIRIESPALKELPVGSTIKVEVQNKELGVTVNGEFEALPQELSKVVKAGDEFRVIPNGAAKLVVAEKAEIKGQQKLVDLLGIQDKERASLAKLVTESSMLDFAKAAAKDLPPKIELEKQEIVHEILKNFATVQEAPDTAKPIERLQVLLKALESTVSGNFKDALKEVITLQTNQLSDVYQSQPSVESYNELLKTLPEPRPELRLSENPTLKELFQVFSKVSEEASKADAPQVYKLLEANLLAIANEKLSEVSDSLKEIVTEPKQMELLQKLTELNLIPKIKEREPQASKPLERLEVFSKALEASSSGNFKQALQEIINLQPLDLSKVYQKLLSEQPALQSYNELVESLPTPKPELILSEHPTTKELQEVFSKITNEAAKEQPELAKLLEAKFSAVVFEKLLTEESGEAKETLRQMLSSPNQQIVRELENVLPKVDPQKIENSVASNPVQKLEVVLKSFESTVNADFRKALTHVIDVQANKLIENAKQDTINSKDIFSTTLRETIENSNPEIVKLRTLKELLTSVKECIEKPVEPQKLKELLTNVKENLESLKPETINQQNLKELLTSVKENIERETIDPQKLKELLSNVKDGIENIKPETANQQNLKDFLSSIRESIENIKPETVNSQQLKELLTNIKEGIEGLKPQTVNQQNLKELLSSIKDGLGNIKPEVVNSQQLKELLTNIKDNLVKFENTNPQDLKELLTNLKENIENIKPENVNLQTLKDLLTSVKEGIESLKPETINQLNLKDLLSSVKEGLKTETTDPQKLKEVLVNVKENIEKIDIKSLPEQSVAQNIEMKQIKVEPQNIVLRGQTLVSKNVEAFNELVKDLPVPKPELQLNDNPSLRELGEVFKKLSTEVIKDPVTFKPLEEKLLLATFEKLLVGDATKEPLNELFAKPEEAEKLKSLLELKAMIKAEDLAPKLSTVETAKPFAELEALLKTLDRTVNGNFREALETFIKLQPTALLDKFQELLKEPASITTFNELVKELGLPELSLSESPSLKELLEVFTKLNTNQTIKPEIVKPLEAMFMTLALENLLTEDGDENTVQIVRQFFSEPEKVELLRKLVNLNLIPKNEDGTVKQLPNNQTIEQVLKTLEGAVTNDFRKALEDVVGIQTERLISDFKAAVPQVPTVERYNEIVKNLSMPELTLSEKPSVQELLQVFSKLTELVQKEPAVYKPLEMEFLTIAYEKFLTSDSPVTTEVLRNILSNPRAAQELRSLIDLNITLKTDDFSADLLKQSLNLLFAAESLQNQPAKPSFKTLEHLFNGGVLDLQKPLQKIMREMLVSKTNIPDLQQLFDVTKDPVSYTKAGRHHSRALTQFLELSASMKQLNSIFRTLGEPTYYFYPVLVGNHFSLFELTYFPMEQLIGDKIREKRRKRLKAKTTLESLGTVEVDASYCEDEVDIDFIFEEERSANFAKRYLSLLHNRLASLGYGSVKLRCRTEKTEDIAPTWVRELGREVCLA